MKWWGLIGGIGLLAFGCGTERTSSSYKGKEVQLVNEEPTYKKDQRLEEYTKNRTNSHGTTGPGNGGSYSSYSYRQSAIKAKNDTIKDPVMNKDQEVEGRDGLAADTADTGVSW